MTENERKTMMSLADTIQGEINRMCVTKELSELDAMYGHAKKNLDKLSKMIYDARFGTNPDVAPGESAEWISKVVSTDGDYAGWTCSNCGKFYANSKACFYKYCPECGAKMRWK